MVLILGSGFLGSAIYSTCIQNGMSVKVCSRSPNDIPVKDYINFDIRDVESIEWLLEESTTVIFCISSSVPVLSINHYKQDIDSFFYPTFKLLQTLSKKHIRRFIFLSSGGAVYGNPLYLPVDELHPTNPISSYGILRLALENYCKLFMRSMGLKCVVIRPSNVYGNVDTTGKLQGVISYIIKAVREDTELRIWGDGSATKDYLHVDDFTSGILKIINATKLPYDIFNLSFSKGYSLNNIIQICEDIFNCRIKKRYGAKSQFDVHNIVLDNLRFRETFDWKPKITLKNGIKNCYENWD